MTSTTTELPVLDYLRAVVAGTATPDQSCRFRYPTAISRTLGIRLVAVDHGTATVEIDTDAAVHGNQQGTVHGGLLAELADAAIGTAHSTVVAPDESFTSIDLRAVYLRPVWRETLRAVARPVHSGRTITHYQCEVVRADGTPVALVTSVVTTLRGERAAGR
ncbi:MULTISPECIES: PaaI family thioesterase [Nocardia]|uniref:PaaI family thioesterase n=1 Tax=Nocardia TaxID=1817 RepID=UPI000BEFD631|nr:MULTISPECIES: PaaI family thioesterase [Nocardia]PEH75130.1 thioesterase [Nocardia sp. FDAARGOS_372]UEX24672.1 PaaI family thioesterase [Nocardia farcinica]